MRLLLDTHALAWFLSGDARLPARVRAAIEAEGTAAHVSPATAWEIATKVRLGKWPQAAFLAEMLSAIMARYTFVPLAITLEHARHSGLLPFTHRDPFDRMLAAQAQLEGMPLVTADPVFRSFGTAVFW